MTRTNTKLTSAVKTNLAHLRRVSASGGATGELSRYSPLTNLLTAVGGAQGVKTEAVLAISIGVNSLWPEKTEQ